MRSAAVFSIDETEAEDLRATSVRERQAPPVRAELQGHRLAKCVSHHANLATISRNETPPSSPERVRSMRRRAGRALDARTLDEACRLANASHADAGAAWDRSREQAREVRAGERPVEPHLGLENAPSDDAAAAFVALLLARLAEARPAAFERVLRMLGERARGER